jgi:hypothetical protein
VKDKNKLGQSFESDAVHHITSIRAAMVDGKPNGNVELALQNLHPGKSPQI